MIMWHLKVAVSIFELLGFKEIHDVLFLVDSCQAFAHRSASLYADITS